MAHMDEALQRLIEPPTQVEKETSLKGPHSLLSYMGLSKSGRQDLNLRPLRPERSALAKLSYSPKVVIQPYTITNPESWSSYFS